MFKDCKILFLFCLLPGLYWGIKAQDPAGITPSIERHEYYTLTGKIDGKPILMHLERNGSFCGMEPNNRMNAPGFSGYYASAMDAERVELVGYMKDDANKAFIKLYVPDPYLPSEFNTACELTGFDQAFIAATSNNFKEVLYSNSQNTTPRPANLELLHDFSFKTTATLAVAYKTGNAKHFNLTALTGLSYIDDVEVIAQKELVGALYLILKFGNTSIPGSDGMGFCGVGYEGYLGFMHIDEDYELADFDYKQVESCLVEIIEDYTYDTAHPENGLIPVE